MADWRMGLTCIRAALHADRIPMMELLVAHGAVVNADWNGDFPILFAPRETLDSVAISWLIAHGADPNRRGTAQPVTALRRSEFLYRHILGIWRQDQVQSAGCHGSLAKPLGWSGDAALPGPGIGGSALVDQHFAELDFGSTGGWRLLLRGATLLHAAAEYG